MADNEVLHAYDKQDGKRTTNGVESGVPRKSTGKVHDPNVTFEEYYYYAQLSRAHPSEAPDVPSTAAPSGIFKYIPFKKGTVVVENSAIRDEKDPNGFPGGERWHEVSQEEYVQASRALRTATWGAVFYLVTTDILGPFSTGSVWLFSLRSWFPLLILWQMGV